MSLKNDRETKCIYGKSPDSQNPKKTAKSRFPNYRTSLGSYFHRTPGKTCFFSECGLHTLLENGTLKVEVSSSVCQKYAEKA